MRLFGVGNIGHRVKVSWTQTVMIKKRIKQKELHTAFIYRSQSLHGAAESSRCTYMCENGPRSDRRVCVYVCMWVRACVSGSILSLYFIPKPSPSSVALPLLPAPIFFRCGPNVWTEKRFPDRSDDFSLTPEPTVWLNICPRLCCVCAHIFFLFLSFWLFLILILSLSHSSIFVQFRIYMATTTVWVGFRLSLFSSSHFAKSPDRSHAAAPQIQKQIRLFFSFSRI